MNSLSFFAKRILRPGFLLCLLLSVLLSYFSGFIGRETALRPSGVFNEDHSAVSDIIEEELLQDGYVRYEDYKSLEASVSNGSLNCGIVLCSGLSSRLRENNLSGSVILLTGSTTLAPEIYREQIIAKLFTRSCVARTVAAAQAVGVSLNTETLEQELDRLYAEGARFKFTISLVNGKKPDASASRENLLSTAAAVILLFTAALPSIRRELLSYRAIRFRVGRSSAFFKLLLPCIGCILFCLFAAGLLSGLSAVPLFAYLFVLLFWAFLYSLLPERFSGIVLSMILIGSIALFPIWFDYADLIPYVGIIRIFFAPAAWMTFCQHPIITSGVYALLSSLLFLLILFIPRYKHA